MGRLITQSDLSPDPSWFFYDAHYSWEGRRWIYKWPNDSFPFHVSIHSDDLKDFIDRKIEIRHWIETNITGTVIQDTEDRKYRIYLDEERTWEHSFEQQNLWMVFYFENKEDAFMFKLRFSEYAKDITDLHPTRNHHYERTSHYKTHR